MTFRKKNQAHENNPSMVNFPFPVVAAVAQSGFSTLPSDKLLRMASKALGGQAPTRSVAKIPENRGPE